MRKSDFQYILKPLLQCFDHSVHSLKVGTVSSSWVSDEVGIHLSDQDKNLEPPGMNMVSVLLLVCYNVRALRIKNLK